MSASGAGFFEGIDRDNLEDVLNSLWRMGRTAFILRGKKP
jgi:hypothetical protein